jgi:hypothetical protein
LCFPEQAVSTVRRIYVMRMGMALRKRSYKWGSDKWLGAALHNMRVDAHRGRRAKDERNDRLASIQTKLRGAGIDGSWAEVALGIMEANGYGLNQFSNKVLPVLRERMNDSAREEDRKARAGELRRIDAGKKNAALSEARQQESQCISNRLKMTADLKVAKDDVRKITWLDPAFDSEGAKTKALSSTIDELSSDIQHVKSALDNSQSSIHDIRLAVSKSLFLDYAKSSVLKCLVLIGLDALVFYLVFSFINARIGGVEPNAGLVLLLILGFLAGPILMIRHLVWLRRPKVRLSMPVLMTRFQSHFLSMAKGQGALPPALAKSDIPQGISTSIQAINAGLRLALKRRAA